MGDNILRTLEVCLQPIWRNWPAKQSNSVKKKRKIRAITPLKVIQGHRGRYQFDTYLDRKPVCDFLLVINSNWHPISYRFGFIAAYCSNFGHCVFEPPFGSLGTTHDVHLGLMGKHVVYFLLVLIELFFASCYGWGDTSENRLKIGDFAPTRSLWHKVSGKGVAPTNHFRTDS